MKRHLMLALALLAGAAPLSAATCEVTVESNDAMQFNLKEITIDRSCMQFTVHLKHVGKLAKVSMGHNWVLAKTADLQAVATDGAKAGPANGYLVPDDPRVIAHTAMIGGGESDSVTFDVERLGDGGDYSFFCSFPGHWGVMKGVVKF
ncbi:azurin [Thauera sp. WB-2]|uniref:azurin n=1 Tax=Thauera sp. WB-2 TaxID=2897772 RepID=UPI0022DD3447|nr:azurin [Thauera sp. WB-2]WBL66037.1 azurin [Thauera sp. WB-2]